jgi:hypothetical protein
MEKSKSHSSIFDRLCDSNQYTGSHQHRFDAAGNGLGLQGREPIMKGLGTHLLRPHNGVIYDIAQVMRTDLGPNDYSKPVYKDGPAPPIYKKLCDHKFYTGTHQHRFDKHGHGLGMQGREYLIKGDGSLDFPHRGGVIRDIGDIMRLELRTGIIERPSASSLGTYTKPKLCKVKGCSATRHPNSQRKLCSFHMWNKDEPCNYRKPGQTHFEAPKPSKRDVCKKNKCGRLRAAGRNLCEYHQWVKEDVIKPKAKTKSKKNKTSTTTEPEQKSACSLSTCIADRYKLGYCQEHYEKITGDVAEKETKVPKHKRRRMKKAKKFTVFDKLNDPSEFTGFHVHRFDNMG